MCEPVAQICCDVDRAASLDRRRSLFAKALARAMALVAVAIALTASNLLAEHATTMTAPSTIYRRIFVPADNVAGWPRGEEKFLPVEAHDFDAWVADADRSAGSARIVEAEYQVRFDGRQLVDGHGRWKVELADDRPAFFSLDETSLVIRNAKWRGAANQPARVGWWARGANEPLAHGLQVAQSGELAFDWHTLRSETAVEDFDFELRLPNAVIGRLSVDLAEGMIPSVEGGLVIESRELTADETKDAADVVASQKLAGNWRRWTWALGAPSTHLLHIGVAAGNQPASPPAAMVREDTGYHVTNHGLDMEVRLRLNSGDAGLRELNLLLTAGPKIISISANDQEVPWHPVNGSQGSATRVRVDLPSASSQGETVVVLKAWDDSVLQQSWTLPTVQVENAFWSSGTSELKIDAGLELQDLASTGCTQTAVRQSDSSNENQSTLEFQSYLPTANLEVRVGPRLPTIRARIGTSLEVGGATVTGRMVSRLQVSGGSFTTMSAELQPGWTIDAVETVPVEALGQWFIDNRGDASRLNLELNRAASSATPIAIVVNGERRRTEPLDSLERDTLEMLRWQGAGVARNLLQLSGSGRYEFKPSSELSTVSIDELSDDDRRLFAAPTDGRLLDLQLSPPTATIGLTPTAAIYDADIELDATIHGTHMQQTYYVLCRPRRTGIDQVMIYFSEPLGTIPHWEDAETHEAISAERMPENDPRMAGFSPGGELWSLRLPRIYARPVSLSTQFETPLSERLAVALISLPDAAAERGRAIVRSLNAGVPAIIAQAMPAAPLPVSADRLTTAGDPRICEIYDYEPARAYQAAATPRLWLGPASRRMSELRIVARQADVESFFAADGSGVHRVVYELENVGAGSVSGSFPADVRLTSASLDDKPIPVPTIATGDGFLLLLPTSFERGTLKMELRSAGPPLTTGQPISAPLPSGDMQVIAGNWTIWLPAEFEAAGNGLDLNLSEFDWRRRLFGPLIWPGKQRAVTPYAVPNELAAAQSQSAIATDAPTLQLTAFPSNALEANGWRRFHTSFAVGPPDPIHVVGASRSIAVFISVLLLSLCVAALWRMPAKPLIIIVAAAAVLALYLPASASLLATGVVWGLLLSPIARWTFAMQIGSQVSAGSSRIARGSKVELASLGMLATLLCLVSDVHAQSSNQRGPQISEAAIHHVLVPVDAQGQPAGSKYFVDEQFLRQLIERSAAKASTGGTWLLSNLRCEGKLPAKADQRSPDAGKWTIMLDVETLARDALVELPFVKSQAAWSASGALDGIPAAINWNADGIGCSVVADEPGRHQFAIEFAPFVHESNGMRQLEMAVPPLAGADFRLAFPSSNTSVAASGGQFETRGGPQGTELVGELDGTGRVKATWLEGGAVGSVATSTRIDELSWLHIQQDAVELQTKYVMTGGAPDAIVITGDRQWDFVSEETDSADVKIEPLGDGRQSIRVPVPGESADRRVVSLRFHLRDAILPGQLRLPALDLTSLSAASRRLAISTDPGWECEPMGGAVVAGGTSAADFSAAWGASDAGQPQIVLNASECRLGWYLAVRPHAVESNSDERLTIDVGRQLLKVRYEADVRPQGVHRFRWSLVVPEGLTIDEVRTESSGQPVALDFVRAGPDRVNVFFALPVESAFHLTLAGTAAVIDSGECPLPRIAAIDRPKAREIVQIYRDDSVSVRPRNIEVIGPREPSSGGGLETAGQQFVGTYAVDQRASEDARLVVEPLTSEATRPVTKAESPVTPTRPRPDELQPTARLVESYVFLAPSGSWFALTRFVIAPHGLTQCVLQMPNDQSLAQAQLDDHAALTQKIDNGRWRVQLGPPALPQSLVIVSRGVEQLDPAARVYKLARPILRNEERPIPVEVSLWSLSRPESATVPRAMEAAIAGPLESAVFRLDRLTSIAESAMPMAIEATGDDTRNWFIPRATELLSAQRRVQMLRSQADNSESHPSQVQTDDDPATLAVARSVAWLTQAKEWVGGLATGHDRASEPTAISSSQLLTDVVLGQATANFISEGGADQLAVEFLPVGLTMAETRMGLLAIIVTVAALSIWLIDRKHAAS
jgi:hypothetical protein